MDVPEEQHTEPPDDLDKEIEEFRKKLAATRASPIVRAFCVNYMTLCRKKLRLLPLQWLY